MSVRAIPDTVRDRQALASDPAVSAWVAANAGAGKTHVLAQRVIRLLLDGVPPGRILCITFTKAAAANMANRVFGTLAGWTALDDDALERAMREIGVRRIDADTLATARRLFAQALDTPGGLKVQTIHAFCTHLLHLFPFEANVAARFTVLDEATETQLLDEITLRVLLDAAADPDGALGRALATAITAAADQTFRDVIAEAIRERDALQGWIEAAGGVEAAAGQLSAALGLAPADSEQAVEAAFFDEALIAADEWPAVAAALISGSKTDADQAQRFRALAGRSGPARIDGYLEIFCTRELTPRKSLATKKIQSEHPALFGKLVAEQQRVCVLIERRRAVAVRDRSAALIAIADAVLRRYRTEKDRRGLLDYDDLIDRALALLNDTSAAWVQYKLDRGIDHVLIDEAQDTSPKQWAIIRALVAEFFAGAGARTVRRTIFAVGDEKQSIFSFQGAAPHEFDTMRREFERQSTRAEQQWRHVRFEHSFRSGGNVLAAVDDVFRAQAVYASVTSDAGGMPPHLALPEAAPGVVEIWDTERPSENRRGEDWQGWDAPFDSVDEQSPTVRLAARIARTVRAWQRAGRAAGEVLVLVRRRGALFEAIIRALKNESIAVAGADRLVLTEHIAVMDLMVLADALLLPDDDLALATVLKSPLFGFDDDELFAIAFDRGRTSLRAALAHHGGAKFMAAAVRLDDLAAAARQQTPFAFYADLLGAQDARRRILSRLGHEAADALDEFLNLALDYERSHTPSLQGFVAWLRAARAEVKRDMEIARDEVRVMTVHGAKGLEAPIVILADTTSAPQGYHPPRLLALPRPGAASGTPAPIAWAQAKADDVGPMAEARAAATTAAQDEYRRLLYVAMTRAAERLIVCGVDGERKRPDGCWYDLVHDALAPSAVEEPADDGAGTVLRFRKQPEAPRAAAGQAPPPASAVILPDWLTQHAKPEPAAAEPLAPSRALDAASVETSSGRSEGSRLARRRGTALHRLMQSLPDIAPEQRGEAARRFLARIDILSDTERAAIAERALATLTEPRFAALFRPGSRAEVPIVGRRGDRPVAGVVDRLVVTPDAVLIADYKTDRPPPRDLAELKARHPGYVLQLALYRAVLQRFYPGRTVEAMLVWTETLQSMPIPAELLDTVLAGM